MRNPLNDFSAATKRLLQESVGNHCSNPNCDRCTSGPNSDPSKVTRIGVAAHITAASPGGARYCPELTNDDRSSSENGIWLCQACATFIDRDPDQYSVDVLLTWKHFAQENKRREIEGLPPLDAPEQADWNCGWCFNPIKHLQPMCGHCNAEVAYSLTRKERDELQIMGMVVGVVFCGIIFVFFPQILNSHFAMHVPIGLGLGVYAIALTVILAVLLGKIFVHKSELYRENKPPRFFRITNI